MYLVALNQQIDRRSSFLVSTHHVTVLGMAGRIRQPVDEAALEKYISEHVPTIKTPIDLKQVSSLLGLFSV